MFLSLRRKPSSSLMIESLKRLPDQIRLAINDGKALNFPQVNQTIDKVVINGMGGSNLGAYIIKAIFQPRLKIPILIEPGYTVSGYVNSKTLYIISSYSGTTEEPLHAYKAAKRQKAIVAAITSNTNNPLKRLAEKEKLSAYIFSPDSNPSGQPRLGLGYTIVSLLVMLKKFNIISLSDKEIEEIISNLKKPIYLSLTHQKGDKYADDGFFDDNKNKIFIYGKKNENNRTTAAHELSHKANHKKDLIENKKFKEIFGVDLVLAKENPNFLMDYKEDADGMFDYLSSTTEIDARQNSTRFYLYKNFPGYTVDTSFTPEHYYFLKENYQKLPFGIRQLLDFWTTKEAFISCMNKF